MRRILVSLMALVIGAGLVAPASGDPHVRRDEQAHADWFIPTEKKNEFKWFGAYASRSTVVGAPGTEPFSYAGFAKGHCTREKTPKYISIECLGTDFIPADPDKDFEMSPLATDATLRVRKNGRTHVARWSSTPAGLSMYSASEYCFVFKPGEQEPEEEGEGHGGGFWNPATAGGSFFGERLHDKNSRWAGLAVGAMVSTCSFRDVAYSPEEGITGVTFRIPR